MKHLLVVMIFCGAALASQTVPGKEDIQKAAQNRVLLERLLRTRDFDLNLLWQELKIADQVDWGPMLRCDEFNCNVDLISPRVTQEWIMWIQVHQQVVMLRYRQKERFGDAQFLGCYRLYGKYFDLEHRLAQIDGKTFLLVTEQGEAGTGLSVKMEKIFDLGREKFEPVLSFVEDGHWIGWGGQPGREIHGFLASMEMGASDRVKIHYSARFYQEDDSGALGRLEADAVYTRKGSGEFHFAKELSSAPYAEIESVYKLIDPVDDNPKHYDTDFVRYNFVNLKTIAQGPSSGTKKWLKEYLRGVQSPEAQELRRLAGR